MALPGPLAGAAAGLLATAPMTAAMVAMHRLLPPPERYPLPPREITAKAVDEVGLGEHLDEQERTAATLVSHFAYGAAAGALYAPMAGRIPFPSWLGGIIYGLLVWALSYLGLLPALGLQAPATKQPAGRNALMIAAHVVWGSVTGLLTERFGRKA